MTAAPAGRPPWRVSAGSAADGSAAEPPVLGLVGGPAGPGLRELLAALAGRCIPRFVDPSGTDGTAAYLCTADAPQVPMSRPYAVWLGSAADLQRRTVGTARVLLTNNTALLPPGERAGPPIELVPVLAAPTGVPIGPAVRARLRAARGLDHAPIAAYEHAAWRWADPAHTVDPSLADTLCGVAAAVVATTPAEATRAMSWAAPTVTDPATADQLGAITGVHVVVAGTRSERWQAAQLLAADGHTAARLGRAARDLVASRHDITAVARRVGDQLGLPCRGVGPAALLDDALDALGAPISAPIYTRSALALLGFPARPGSTIR